MSKNLQSLGDEGGRLLYLARDIDFAIRCEFAISTPPPIRTKPRTR